MSDIKVKMTDCVQISVETTDKNGRWYQDVRYVERYRDEMDDVVKEMIKEIKEEIDGIHVNPCPYCGNTTPELYCFGDWYVMHCSGYICDKNYYYIGNGRKNCVIGWNNRDEVEIIKKYKEAENETDD